MKLRITPFTSLRQTAPAAAFTVAILAIFSPAQAATFNWDGGDAGNGSWGAASNWNPNVAPTFNNTADLIFNNLTRSTTNEFGFSRTVRSISFGEAIDGTWTTNTTTGAVLSYSADAGNASVNVDAGATANITFNGGVGFTGSQSLTSQLELNHNGSGLLLFNRQFAGAGGFTKNGNGTASISAPNNNSFTGAVNVNTGRLIMGSTSGATGDMNASSGINLGGGILEIRTTGALNKQINPNMIVSVASSLAYNNTAATDQSFTLQTGTMALNANLTVQNISSSGAGNNIVNITRNLTGSGNLIIDTYNNVASGAVAFSNGRIQLSGDNTGWTGNLVIAKGTAQFSGTNSFLPAAGSITLGTTGNASGAALGFNQIATDASLSNAITVTTGGVRLIRNNAGPASTNNIGFSGAMTLEGNLTIDHAGLGSGKAVTLSGDIAGSGGLNVTFVGPNQVSATSVRLTGNNGYSGNTMVGAGATLAVNSSGGNGIGNTSAVSLTGDGSTLQLETSETIGSLASTGALGSLVITGNLTTGGNDTNTTYGGSSTGTGGLVKAGSGTFNLTGNGTYTGTTTVTSGTLSVGTTGSIDSTSGVSIGAGEFRYNSSTALSKAVTFSATGGTLSGTGTITPDSSITVGNALAIGDGTIGTMSFGGALAIEGTYLYELDSSTSASDLGEVTGNLSLGGMLDIVQLGTYTGGSKFTLFAYDGTLSGTFSGIADEAIFTDAGGMWTMNYNDTTAGLNGGVSANNTYVTITAIPEPNVVALLGGLGAIALIRRRRA